MVPWPCQKYRKEGYTSLVKEELIQKAVMAVRDGKYKNAADAARAFDIEEQYKTVWHRLTGKTKSQCAAHMTAQLLNKPQEKILVLWIKFLGGVNMCPEWFVHAHPKDPKWSGDILITTTETGWTNDKAETIVQSWAKSGIDKDPKTGGGKCNSSHFTTADFAPSNSTSTQLQLPNSYPTRPTSPSSPSESSLSESGSDDDSSSSEGDDWQDFTTACHPRHRPTVPSFSVVASTAAAPSAMSTPPSLPVPVFTNIYDNSDSELDDNPPANTPMPTQIAHYQARNRKLKEQWTRALQQRDEAASHAILAGDYAKTLKGQLNSKNTARGTSGRIIHTQSRILTTAEGRAAATVQKDARNERDAAVVQRQMKKDDAAAASQACRAELTAMHMSFTGSFKQLKLGELQDLAWALGLDEKGTKSVLLERAQAHFKLPSNDALQKDLCCVMLFGKRKHSCGNGSADDEPVTGPSTLQRSPPRR
ncbi:hypothetical protein B0H14DRAFT_3788621 [Mycena olivaceomarginata]|nr:hypothetical protein B0H14DRAFT_3788621 [Mycena olivaceomarginata]